jgi:hypothetical protein
MANKPALFKVTGEHPVSLPDGSTGGPGEFVTLADPGALVADGHLTPAPTPTNSPRTDTTAESATPKEK